MSIVTGRKLNRFFEKIKTVFADKNIYGNYSMSLGRKSDSAVGGISAVVGGYDNVASGSDSAVVGGYDNVASGSNSAITGGWKNTASSYDSTVVGGLKSTASGDRSAVVGGDSNTASGTNSAVVGGYGNIAKPNQLVTGHCNNDSLAKEGDSLGTGTGTALCIGNGTATTRSNAIRVDYNGKLWCKSAYSSTGADYAELFEWSDGNPNNEVRYGYFVTMVGNKIKKANAGDWILGIVSANPCILGNSDMEWQGQFLRDEFGAFIMEDIIVTEKRLQPKLGESGEQVYEQVEVEVPCQFYKVNPDYDPDQEYIDRISRPEWDAIGMLGVLAVFDDGTCEVDGFCTVADGGIATANIYGYRVIERVTENIVKVVINAESSNMVLALLNRIELLEQQIKKLSA